MSDNAQAGPAIMPTPDVVSRLRQNPALEIEDRQCAPALKGKRAGVLLYSLYLIDPRARRAAEAMKASGMEVDVLCISEGSHEPSFEIADGVRVSRLAMTHQRKNKLSYLWQYARFFTASFWFLTWGN